MLRHIRLLVSDLDYIVFDCSLLKVRALRQSLISFAETIPHDVRLPDATDAEEGFRLHGFRWTRFLEIGMDEEQLGHLQHAYGIHEERLIQAGVGQIYAGVADLVAQFRRDGASVALGAEASRDYLMTVSDKHGLESLFDMSLCTEEFGSGSADEMLEEIMHYAEVNPSETLVLGTRPSFFDAAHNLDILTIGCGWGVRQHGGLEGSDLRAMTQADLYPAIRKADAFWGQYPS